MKKNYEVMVTAYATVLVLNAESDEQAYEYARDELHGDFEIEGMEIGEIIDPSDVKGTERIRRHANVVAEDT